MSLIQAMRQMRAGYQRRDELQAAYDRDRAREQRERQWQMDTEQRRTEQANQQDLYGQVLEDAASGKPRPTEGLSETQAESVSRLLGSSQREGMLLGYGYGDPNVGVTDALRRAEAELGTEGMGELFGSPEAEFVKTERKKQRQKFRAESRITAQELYASEASLDSAAAFASRLKPEERNAFYISYMNQMMESAATESPEAIAVMTQIFNRAAEIEVKEKTAASGARSELAKTLAGPLAKGWGHALGVVARTGDSETYARLRTAMDISITDTYPNLATQIIAGVDAMEQQTALGAETSEERKFELLVVSHEAKGAGRLAHQAAQGKAYQEPITGGYIPGSPTGEAARASKIRKSMMSLLAKIAVLAPKIADVVKPTALTGSLESAYKSLGAEGLALVSAYKTLATSFQQEIQKALSGAVLNEVEIDLIQRYMPKLQQIQFRNGVMNPGFNASLFSLVDVMEGRVVSGFYKQDQEAARELFRKSYREEIGRLSGDMYWLQGIFGISSGTRPEPTEAGTLLTPTSAGTTYPDRVNGILDDALARNYGGGQSPP